MVEAAPRRHPDILPQDTSLPLKERKARFVYALRTLMEYQGISGKKLAAAVGVKENTVNRWANGVNVPSILYLGSLCTALGVIPEYFASPPPVPVYPIESYQETKEQRIAERMRLQGTT